MDTAMVPSRGITTTSAVSKTRSQQIAGRDIYFNMHVDTQFPNIFRAKNLKQPFTMFNIKTIVEAKASQLVQTLLDKLQIIQKRDPEIARLGITEKNISLYFHCQNGDRWWFENSQRIADIVDSGHWSAESILQHRKDQKNNLNCIYFVICKR